MYYLKHTPKNKKDSAIVLYIAFTDTVDIVKVYILNLEKKH